MKYEVRFLSVSPEDWQTEQVTALETDNFTLAKVYAEALTAYHSTVWIHENRGLDTLPSS